MDLRTAIREAEVCFATKPLGLNAREREAMSLVLQAARLQEQAQQPLDLRGTTGAKASTR